MYRCICARMWLLNTHAVWVIEWLRQPHKQVHGDQAPACDAGGPHRHQLRQGRRAHHAAGVPSPNHLQCERAGSADSTCLVNSKQKQVSYERADSYDSTCKDCSSSSAHKSGLTVQTAPVRWTPNKGKLSTDAAEPQAGLVAPVLFNIQDSLLHIEALAMDVSPRLINIEPTLIRLQARHLLQLRFRFWAGI